ncbi:MAG TPA: aminoglycoside phosphotransferase [Cytophagales bacterium]|nr:aminoglycoside phosphotransferase [Cytophagales bacterium]HAA20456.1 aminoglycoside phosphotransferase [Cytophagales bacterium]HAP64688.1 aminoglycoside phosphotransferase [Cytophagales bacterium]
MSVFPVTESTLSAEHLAAFLRQQYGLGSNTTCTLFRKGMNHVYMVQDGATGYVLRIYSHNWRTPVEIAEELRWMMMAQASISVPKVIEDQEGKFLQAFQAPEGQRYGVLFSKAPGKKDARFSKEASHNIGQAMAKLHRQAEGITLERTTYNTQILHKDAIAGIREFFPEPTPTRLFMDKLSQWLPMVYSQVDEDQVRSGAVHLDIWFDNLHIHDDQQVTIFDFDFCGNGWLVHDVSYFLYQLFYTHPDPKAYEEKAIAFLEGYEKHLTLSPAERNLLPTACLSIMLFYLHTQIQTFDNFSNVFMSHDHLTRNMMSMQRWMEYHELSLP